MIMQAQTPPPNERPTAQQLASQSNTGGVVCPGCGSQLFSYKTQTGSTRIIRYEECRNPSCSKRFRTRQEHREIIEEIKPKAEKLSSAGNPAIEDEL